MKKLLFLVALLVCLVAGWPGLGAVPKPTCALAVSPTNITSGGSSTLSWTTTGAGSVVFNGVAQSANGSVSVSPTVTTTYTVVAVGKAPIQRIQQCRITVAVAAATPNLQHSLWFGGDYNTSVSPGGAGGTAPSEQAQWVLDNIINVTPTSKRPQTIQVNANVDRQTKAQATAANISVITGLGGDWGLYAYPGGDNLSAGITAHPQYATLVAIKDGIVASGRVTYLYVDEPASTYGCSDLSTAPCLNRQVTVYNQAFDYLKGFQPSLKTGFCLWDKTLQLNLLRAGLHADFVCLESYVQAESLTTQWSAIHAEYPGVEKMPIFSDTFPLCQAWDWTATGAAPWPVTVAYWNINMYALWFAGVGLDMDFLANAQEYASTGQRQFCNNPRPTFSDAPNAAQVADFLVYTYNSSSLALPNATTLTKCEVKSISYLTSGPDYFAYDFGPNFYLPRVAATGVETLPWTEIPCAGNNPALPGVPPAYPSNGTAFKITVGPGQMCRNNGIQPCHVYLRATNSLGRVGTRNFPFSINHPSLPGYQAP
jgi:hypothetical protein